MMQDFHLILFVFVLALIDVIFITIWVCYDPLKTENIVFEDKIKQTSELITIPVLKICECNHRTKLLGAMFGYKGILLLFGVFLAWETRNVTIPALNDSKYIGMSVYNVVILSAVGATASMVLKKTVYYDLLHILVSSVVLLSTTVTLTMVFAPKVYEYYTTPPKPEGRVRTMQALQMSVRSTTTTTTECSEVYEAYIQRKGVKHKWIQTEDFEQAPKDTIFDGVNQGRMENKGYCMDKEDGRVLVDKL